MLALKKVRCGSASMYQGLFVPPKPSNLQSGRHTHAQIDTEDNWGQAAKNRHFHSNGILILSRYFVILVHIYLRPSLLAICFSYFKIIKQG